MLLVPIHPAPPGAMGQSPEQFGLRDGCAKSRANFPQEGGKRSKGADREEGCVMVIVLLNCFDSSDHSFLILTKT